MTTWIEAISAVGMWIGGTGSTLLYQWLSTKSNARIELEKQKEQNSHEQAMEQLRIVKLSKERELVVSKLEYIKAKPTECEAPLTAAERYSDRH